MRAILTRFAVLAAAGSILAAAALSAGAVDAAKGGRPGSGGQTTGTCWVSPNPVPLNTGYAINGASLAQQPIVLTVQTAAGTLIRWPHVEADGTWSVSMWAGSAGDYTATVETNGDRKPVVLARCSFRVTS